MGILIALIAAALLTALVLAVAATVVALILGVVVWLAVAGFSALLGFAVLASLTNDPLWGMVGAAAGVIASSALLARLGSEKPSKPELKPDNN